MILTKTPLRISFVGGGSDLPSFYDSEPEGGAVVSMAISKFIYVAVNKKFDDRIRVSYSLTEDVQDVYDLEHDLVCETLLHYGVYSGIEVVSIADIPGKGTGLGSSSSFTVGLAKALGVYTSRQATSKESLAGLAALIEVNMCEKPIGKQDHYAAAYGGLNLIRFGKEVTVEPISIDLKTFIRLSSRLMLFYTGKTRQSEPILADQQNGVFADKRKRAATREMAELAVLMAEELNNDRLDHFGDYLLLNWGLKRSLSDRISDQEIDMWIKTGLDAGALGAKLCGAGGGGFILFYAPIDNQPAIRKNMTSLGLKEMDFYGHMTGSEIVYRG